MSHHTSCIGMAGRSSVQSLQTSFHKSSNHKSCFLTIFIFRGHSARVPASGRVTVLFCGPTQEPCVSHSQHEKIGRGFGKNAGEWTGWEKQARGKFLAVSVACIGYAELLQAFKGERLSSVFSQDGTLIPASAAPHCGEWEKEKEERKKKKKSTPVPYTNHRALWYYGLDPKSGFRANRKVWAIWVVPPTIHNIGCAGKLFRFFPLYLLRAITVCLSRCFEKGKFAENLHVLFSPCRKKCSFLVTS